MFCTCFEATGHYFVGAIKVRDDWALKALTEESRKHRFSGICLVSGMAGKTKTAF